MKPSSVSERVPVVAFAVLAAGLAGCSLATVHPDACTSNEQCRSAFGYGSVCGDDGLCAAAEIPERCDTVFPPDLTLPIDPSTHYVYGTVFNHTLDSHVGRYESAELAAIEANTYEGLDGHSFAMFHCTNEEGTGLDDLSEEDASVSVAEWLADDIGVPAIVGPASSGDTLAVFAAMKDRNVMVISPSATSPALTTSDVPPGGAQPRLLWRTAPPDSLQGTVIAQDMKQRHAGDVGPVNIAVIYQQGAYGEGLEQAFASSFTSGQVSPLEYAETTELSEKIGIVGSGTFSEVLFISSSSTDVSSFLIGAKDISGFDEIPIFLTDTAHNTDMLTAAASARSLFPQIRGTAPATPSGPVYNSFVAAFGIAHNTDVSLLSYTAQAFDASWLVIYGHAWALYQKGSITGPNVALGMLQISSGAPIDILGTNWGAVRGDYQRGVANDVLGASGDLNYDATGETKAGIEVWTIAPAGDDFDTVDVISP